MSTTDLEDIAAQLRELAARVDLLAGTASASAAFDPATDEPTLRPDVNGTRAQKDWTAVMLWGALASIGIREKRGATLEEVVDIAKAAGYADGRAWNRWSGWVDLADGRWITPTGMSHLRTYLGQVGRTLPAQLDVDDDQLPPDADPTQPRAPKR
jgi:hypothetical protein